MVMLRRSASAASMAQLESVTMATGPVLGRLAGATYVSLVTGSRLPVGIGHEADRAQLLQ